MCYVTESSPTFCLVFFKGVSSHTVTHTLFFLCLPLWRGIPMGRHFIWNTNKQRIWRQLNCKCISFMLFFFSLTFLSFQFTYCYLYIFPVRTFKCILVIRSLLNIFFLFQFEMIKHICCKLVHPLNLFSFSFHSHAFPCPKGHDSRWVGTAISS